MARSKTLTVLVLNKDQNKCLEGHDMMDNSSVVSDWKENFRLSRPTPSHLFEAFCFLLSRQQTAC